MSPLGTVARKPPAAKAPTPTVVSIRQPRVLRRRRRPEVLVFTCSQFKMTAGKFWGSLFRRNSKGSSVAVCVCWQRDKATPLGRMQTPSNKSIARNKAKHPYSSDGYPFRQRISRSKRFFCCTQALSQSGFPF